MVWLNYCGPGQHLLVDVSITGVYRDSIANQAGSIPGFAVKFREDAKLDADMRSSRPVSRVHGGRHRLVPFVLEEGGRFGDHALSFLAELAWRGANSGKLLPPASWKSAGVKDAAHFWLRRWKQERFLPGSILAILSPIRCFDSPRCLSVAFFSFA